MELGLSLFHAHVILQSSSIGRMGFLISQRTLIKTEFFVEINCLGFDFSVLFEFRYAVVEELAGFGAAVHTCSRNEAELSKCLEQWKAKGFSVTGSICNVSSKTEREKLIEQVASTFNGKLNILVSFPFTCV